MCAHQQKSPIDIAIARGDGVGPEIMDACLYILQQAGVRLQFHEIQVGQALYLAGNPSGIDAASWETLQSVQAFLKAPITTPQGGGLRSLNVTIRSRFGLFANVRPCVAYAPAVKTRHPGMDLVIIRENEEDLYAGIEYRPTFDCCEALKVISEAGCEKIIRYAFDYAKTNDRKKVTCFSKDNILKMTDGLFHKTFDRIAKEYPELANEHWIIDIGSAKMADTPEQFDVIVTLNLYGDILSDIAAQIAGSVGLAGSANIGPSFAMFEAIHGSAPRRANQNLANPSGLLTAAVMMLVHLGLFEDAERIHNAWLKTLEEGIHTYDIWSDGQSKQKVGTREFAEAVAARLGLKPEILTPVHYHKPAHHRPQAQQAQTNSASQSKTICGIDVFIEKDLAIQPLVDKIEKIHPHVRLEAITYRGNTVWPASSTSNWAGSPLRLRFQATSSFSQDAAIILLQKLSSAGCRITSSHMLYSYDGVQGFSSTGES